MINLIPTALILLSLLALVVAFEVLRARRSRLRRMLLSVICRFRPHLRSPFHLYKCDQMYLSRCSRCGCQLERRRGDGLWHEVDV
jgi:hypothetical protein